MPGLAAGVGWAGGGLGFGGGGFSFGSHGLGLLLFDSLDEHGRELGVVDGPVAVFVGAQQLGAHFFQLLGQPAHLLAVHLYELPPATRLAL